MFPRSLSSLMLLLYAIACLLFPLCFFFLIRLYSTFPSAVSITTTGRFLWPLRFTLNPAHETLNQPLVITQLICLMKILPFSPTPHLPSTFHHALLHTQRRFHLKLGVLMFSSTQTYSSINYLRMCITENVKKDNHKNTVPNKCFFLQQVQKVAQMRVNANPQSWNHCSVPLLRPANTAEQLNLCVEVCVLKSLLGKC